MTTNEARWVDATEFCNLTGWSLGSIQTYGASGRILQRGFPKLREYLYTGQKKDANNKGGRPSVLRVTNKVKKDFYVSDARVRNTAWLAEHCMKNDLSFTRELDKIIGLYREAL